MRSDDDIQNDIMQGLKWEPQLQGDDIAVGVHDGIVTLAGFTKSYAEKVMAEHEAGRIRGVRAVANDIEVRLPSDRERSDPDLARAALDALKWHTAVPEDRIRVAVERGWMKLDGEVDWHSQKEDAEQAVRALTGVKGVSNLITVKARVMPSDVKAKIKQALHRGVEFDANRISIEVKGNKVILSGIVRAFAEKRDAERATRNAPGVTEVDNQLMVDPYTFAAV